MTHNIALNFNTDLKFKVVANTQPVVVTRIAYSVEKAAFVDIERTRSIGFVDVAFDDATEWIAQIDGARAYEQVTFDAVEVESPDGTRAILWEVYSFSDKGIEDDLEIENVPTADIPDAIVDMLLEL